MNIHQIFHHLNPNAMNPLVIGTNGAIGLIAENEKMSMKDIKIFV